MEWENTPYIIKHQVQKAFAIFKYILIIPPIIIYLLLMYFHLLRGQYFYNLAEQNRSRMFIIFAPRGTIFDYNNIVLADNRPWIRVFYYPFVENRMDYIKRMLEIFPNSKKQLFAGLKTQRIVSLSEDISRDELFKIYSLRHRLAGVSVTTEFRRRYVFNENFAHSIGYISELTHKEFLQLKNHGYKYTDFIGKLGVEKIYEGYLRGQHGALVVEIDAYGMPTKVMKDIPPSPGNNLYLTIDSELQLVAQKALSATRKNGAIVGIDPRNGAIRILVSCKDFDPNAFISVTEDKKKFLTDADKPLLNRCLQGTYPPGSVFKPLMIISALNEKKINPSATVLCKGEFKFGNRIFKCWEKKGHGYVDMHNALRHSCDVYFYNLALKVGIDNIEKYCKLFGFGKKTGIDLPYEVAGVSPSKKWKLEKYNTEWFDGDTVNVGIGQGYITTTPIQLAQLASIIANNGIMYQPYLVEKIADISGNIIYKNEPVKKSVIKIKDEIWDFVENAMIDVVNSGTGYASYIPGLILAGKTGTSQNPQGQDHALFIAFGPITQGEVPPLALAIVVEHGGKGGAVAAPISREIFSVYQKKYTKLITKQKSQN